MVVLIGSIHLPGPEHNNPSIKCYLRKRSDVVRIRINPTASAIPQPIGQLIQRKSHTDSLLCRQLRRIAPARTTKWAP